VISGLSYIGFTTPTAEEWRTFGPEVLGAEVAPSSPDGSVRLRVDEAVQRIIAHPGAENALAYLGWEAGDAGSLEETAGRVEKDGVTVHRGDAELAKLRAVADVAWFTDRFGLRHELSHGLQKGGAFTPGRPISGFRTGEQGLGHVVLMVPELQEGERFFRDVLGFKPSDWMERGMGIRFFHCPGRAARHHTVALAGAKGRVGLHHLMLELNSIDDVGTALDIVEQKQVPLAMSLGRHTNDHMTSFYMRTPSGFEIEYGTGGRLVDDETWTVEQMDKGSYWGHRAPLSGPLAPGMIRRFEPTGSGA
jgi:2,3-dihydroxybiphenyl 1,2-dioxygenase